MIAVRFLSLSLSPSLPWPHERTGCAAQGPRCKYHHFSGPSTINHQQRQQRPRVKLTRRLLRSCIYETAFFFLPHPLRFCLPPSLSALDNEISRDIIPEGDGKNTEDEDKVNFPAEITKWTIATQTSPVKLRTTPGPGDDRWLVFFSSQRKGRVLRKIENISQISSPARFLQC